MSVDSFRGHVASVTRRGTPLPYHCGGTYLSIRIFTCFQTARLTGTSISRQVQVQLGVAHGPNGVGAHAKVSMRGTLLLGLQATHTSKYASACKVCSSLRASNCCCSLSPSFLTLEQKQQSLSLVAQWLNRCTAAKTVPMTWGSIPGSRLKVDSAFYPPEVGQMSIQLV